MKKSIFSIIVIASIAFTGCSKNDDNKQENSKKTCVTCESYDVGGGNAMPKQEICKAEDGTAIVNGIKAPSFNYEEYVNTNKKYTTCK